MKARKEKQDFRKQKTSKWKNLKKILKKKWLKIMIKRNYFKTMKIW